MTRYVEIDKPREIKRLNKELGIKLASALRYTERRNIGWPAGRFRAPVKFRKGRGSDIFWWARRNHSSKAINLFGHGKVGESSALNIEVQFNLPGNTFTRKTGGAFLRDERTGEVLLAHRGIVTLGHGRIPKNQLFQEIACTIYSARSGGHIHEFLLIGELTAKSLVEDLASFSSELRRSVRAIENERLRYGKRGNRNIQHSRLGNRTFSKLRNYFDEFSGAKTIHVRRRKTIADCYHGSIVRAARDHLGLPENAFKSREIDLVIALGKNQAILVEVKTSMDIRSLYTAVGQLVIHSSSVAKMYKLNVKRVIVIPQRPSDEVFGLLSEDLGIRVLTFSRLKNGAVAISEAE